MSFIQTNQVKKVDCFKGDKGVWVVYAWFVGEGGFTLGKFNNQKGAMKLLKDVASKM